jgi:LuxR family maltose regulon positive regulatory protein
VEALDDGERGLVSAQETLEYLERANLFLVPLDANRRWYRYHHLFADLLRQRLQQRFSQQPEQVAGLHARASEWYEENGYIMEAFHHAAAAGDVDRAARLTGRDTIPQHFRGAVTVILD